MFVFSTIGEAKPISNVGLSFNRKCLELKQQNTGFD